MEVDVFTGPVSDAAIDSGGTRIKCPSCGPDRKKRNERTLSITVDGDWALYKCHHCDESGRVLLRENWMISVDTPSEEKPSIDTSSTESLGDSQFKYLESRGISRETAEKFGVVSGSVWIRARNAEVKCIGFPYQNEDGTTAVKWRDGAKNFSQQGAARNLWQIEKFTGGDLVICEGELDVLSFGEAEIFSTSVPNGAPIGEVKNGGAKKFSYLWDCKDKIESADRVIIATDMDGPGNALAEEIARRVGKARCWRVPFPDDCKDANDVLVTHGKDKLVQCLEDATPWPVSGLRNASEYRQEAIDLFNGGFDRGVKSGIYELDNIFRVLPQTLTVVTGVPGSGKSAFLTWMSANLANQGWNCAVLSAETSSQIHILQMASLHAGKPFRGTNKMTEDELKAGLDWVEGQFVFLDESDTEIQSVIDRAHAAVLRNGVRLLVVDPYNFLTGSLEEGSVASINKLLVSLKNLAVERGIAVWLVAHPTKMYRQADGNVPVPGGYDVSGSASFYNVADSGITVSRLDHGKALVTCWKARFPWIGKPGECVLKFDPEIGEFSEFTFEGSGFSDEDFDFD